MQTLREHNNTTFLVAASATLLSAAAAYFFVRRKIKRHEVLMGIPAVDCPGIERVLATTNVAYTHGGAMGAAVSMLRDSRWRSLVEEFTPFTAARLAVLGALSPASAMHILENSPVVGAYAALRNAKEGHYCGAPFVTGAGTIGSRQCSKEEPIVMEWDVYLPPSSSAALSGKDLVDRTVVQHGTLLQIIQERLFGWSMHSEVRQLSGDITIPRWLFAYFSAMKRMKKTADIVPVPGPGPVPAPTEAERSGPRPLLSVFLDVKSTRATPQSLALLVKALNEQYGVRVWAVGSFVYEQLAGLSEVKQSVVVCEDDDDEEEKKEEDECDHAMTFLASRFTKEELVVPNSPVSQQCYLEAKRRADEKAEKKARRNGKAATTTATVQPPAAAARVVDFPPPLVFHLSSSVAKIQSTVEDSDSKWKDIAATTAGTATAEAAATLLAHQKQARLLPKRDALIVFNGGGCLRKELPLALHRAFYAYPSATSNNGTSGMVDYLVSILKAARDGDNDIKGEDDDDDGILSDEGIAKTVASFVASLPASTPSSSISPLAAATQLLWTGFKPSATARRILGLLYNSEAVAYLEHLKKTRAYSFGYYCDEGTLEPLAASLLAGLAHYRPDLFPLGNNSGHVSGECPALQPSSSSSSAASKTISPFANGLVVPWFLRRVIPTDVKETILPTGEKMTSLYPLVR